MEKTYVEKLVTKKASVGVLALRIFTVLVSVLLVYAMLVLIGIYGLVAAFALGCLIYYVFSVTYVEYEMILVKNELSIDSIYGKNKRKTVQNIDVTKCELIAPVTSEAAAPFYSNRQMKTFDYTSGMDGDEIYLMVIPFGAGNARVYFEPGDAMIELMKAMAPGKVKA